MKKTSLAGIRYFVINQDGNFALFTIKKELRNASSEDIMMVLDEMLATEQIKKVDEIDYGTFYRVNV